MFVDICVHAKTEREHDENMLKAMERLREKNLTLNENK